MSDQSMLEKVKQLPSVQREQVLDFIEFPEQKYEKRPRPTFGSGKAAFEMMPDFAEPLDDFPDL